MRSLTRYLGPSVLAASVAFVYHANHSADTAKAPPLSTTQWCLVMFCVYAFGAIPRNRFFPASFFRNNIFMLLYRYAYCSELVGYKLLRNIMHAPAEFPHSDYRTGIRCLSASGLSTVAPPTSTSSSPSSQRLSAKAAAAAAAAAAATQSSGFYGRGGGMIDLSELNNRKSDDGVLIVPVPMFADNYSYLIVSLRTKKVAVVDPADPKAVLRIMHTIAKAVGAHLVLTDILTTHKHWDHSGGNLTFLEYSTGAENTSKATVGENMVSTSLNIYGSKDDKVQSCNHWVKDMDEITVADGGVSVLVMEAPGHTHGSLIFIAGDAAPQASQLQRTAIFTGDCIFSGGLGAPFETVSLEQVRRTRDCFLDNARALQHPATHEPVREEDVLIYAGHEYTERLVAEVYGIIQRALKAAPTESGKRFEAELAQALRGVVELRHASDGLEDVAHMDDDDDDDHHHSHGPGGTSKRFRLPGCTLPSTLAVEKRINPLLTMSKAVLDSVPCVDGNVDQQALERAIYCSTDRTIS